MVALFAAIVLLIPIERYRPSCGDRWNRVYFDGPMRAEYVGMLAQNMAKEGFAHVRIGNELFVKLVYAFHAFDRAPKWDSLGEFLINTEWRIAHSIGAGYGPNGERIVPPRFLLDLMAKVRAIPRPDKSLETLETEARSGMTFSGDCEVLRAAAIRVEDMDSERILHFVPKPSLPGNCSFDSLRAWNHYCGMIVRGTGDEAVIVRKAKGD